MRIEVGKYEELGQMVTAFKRGTIPLLVIDGRAGIGKTEMVSQKIGKTGGTISGYMSPAVLFNTLKKHGEKNEPIVIDDVDLFLSNPDKVMLLKQMCDSKPNRRVSRQTMYEDSRRNPYFNTSSSVCVITNNTGNDTESKLALFDRGFVVDFKPLQDVVHREAKKWFLKDPQWKGGKAQQIYNYIEANLPKAHALSFRDYINAWKADKAGLDYKSILDKHWNEHRFSILQKCVRDNEGNDEPHVQAYYFATGKSRATYFRDQKALLKIIPNALDRDVLGNNEHEYCLACRNAKGGKCEAKLQKDAEKKKRRNAA